MNGDFGSLLLWVFFLLISTVVSAAGFGYFFHKDRDKRKLMFMLAYAFGSLSYLVMLQTSWESVQIMENLFFWSPLPVVSGVFIAVLSRLLRLRDFDKLFQVYLCILAASIFVIVTPLPMKILSPLLFQGMSIIVIAVSVYLVLSRRENPDVMFLLSIVCFASASVAWMGGLSLELFAFAHVFAYVFIALVFVTSRQSMDGGMASFFALRTELTETQEELRIAKEQLALKRELEKTLEELKISQEKLVKAERLAAIGEAATMVGHDLRNPLQAVVNMLYIANRTLESDRYEDLRSINKEIEEQVQYMNKIVLDLRDYARPLKPKLAETSIHELISGTLLVIPVPETVQVSIEIEEESGFPELWADASLMRRVFANLITNALQAMPDGGRLTIRASDTGEAATIQFQDTGVGIPEENLDKIFQPLFTTKAKGQGLGLAVCKRLVKAHKGDIMVETELGRGTTFTIKVPHKSNTSLGQTVQQTIPSSV